MFGVRFVSMITVLLTLLRSICAWTSKFEFSLPIVKNQQTIMQELIFSHHRANAPASTLASAHDRFSLTGPLIRV